MAKVLIGCEFSGVVREAFKAKGHDAWSCDLLDTLIPGQHIKGDILEILDQKWDIAIFHPPCTYLCNSGVHWLYAKTKGLHWMDPEIDKEDIRVGKRWEELRKAKDFFNQLKNAPVEKVCIENPIPHSWATENHTYGKNEVCLGIGKPDQYIQPWEFGHDASKKTGLWLKNLPPLNPTDIIKKERYANQTPSGQNKLGPSKDRGLLRAVTYEGIARAMAEQWG